MLRAVFWLEQLAFTMKKADKCDLRRLQRPPLKKTLKNPTFQLWFCRRPLRQQDRRRGGWNKSGDVEAVKVGPADLKLQWVNLAKGFNLDKYILQFDKYIFNLDKYFLQFHKYICNFYKYILHLILS